MLITIYNPELEDAEETFLSAATPAAASTLTVKNNSGFSGNTAVLVGAMGFERSELALGTGISGSTQITVSPVTTFPHNGDDPVYLMQFNQVKIYKSSTFSGIYDLLDTISIDVNNKDLVTLYDDPDGLSTDWYEIKLYNSVTLDETDFSDPIQGTGYQPNTLGSVIDQVVRRIHDTGFAVLTQDDYVDIANEVNNDLTSQAARPYRFQKKSVPLDVVAGQNYVPLPSDLYKYNYVTVTDTFGGITSSRQIKYPLEYEDFFNKYTNTSWLPQDQIYDVSVDEELNRLMIGPTPLTSRTGVVVLHYWITIPNLDSMGDTLITPNNLIYRYKMLAEAYTAKADADNSFGNQATKYESKYGQEIVKMQRYNRIDEGTPRSMAKHKIPGFRKRYTL